MKVNSIFEHNDCLYNACSDIHNERMSLYIRGYEKSTELLVSHVLESQSDLDSLIYPVMFNYRHYLELCFKELIWLSKQLTQESKDFTKKVGSNLKFEKYDNKAHSLGKLWNEALTGLRAVDPKVPKTLLNHVNRVVDDLSKLDANGQSFRYPENLSWQDTLHDQRYINFVSVAKSFVCTKDQLNQLFCWLGSLQEGKTVFENPAK